MSETCAKCKTEGMSGLYYVYGADRDEPVCPNCLADEYIAMRNKDTQPAQQGEGEGEAFKDVYALKCHESTEVKTGPIGYFVVRVPGGWIYENTRLDSNQMTSTFVPFNTEFI